MLKKSLPEQLKKRLAGQLGEEGLASYEACLTNGMQHGLRINTGRISVREFEELSPWKLTPIPWCPSGFYLDEDAIEAPPSKHPLYYAGAYYLQEPSAMLPAAALPVRPGDRVLDLCAAPGGKSTALAEKLQGEGVLVCNDISATRAKALIKNLELFGVTNAIVTAETPERLAGVFHGYFDKILIDAPCSGEGMFRKSAAMIHDWTPKKPAEYASLQKEILVHAIRMLRPGGMLLYSTCTYAPEEDEGSVQYLLNLPEARELGLELTAIPECPGFLPGNPEWIPEGIPELKKTVHMFPHLLRGEGHYAALFQSTVGQLPAGTDHTGRKTAGSMAARKLPTEFHDFCREMLLDPDPSGLSEQQGYISQLPPVSDLPRLTGLRIMRRGLYLGECKKNRFEPSQALAMTLSPKTYPNCLLLTAEDPRVLRYLRGETIEYEDGEVKNGRVLVTCCGLPLGFGKANNGRIKNNYLPGWRMTS